MHTIHHTDAFVLKVVPAGEANARVWLFTRAFGLVVAAVQGVRRPGAKLAMHLSEYAFVSADLVRGREVWRLTSVEAITNPFIGQYHNGLGRAYVRTLGAVERFCQGEEAHPELFSHLHECLAVLSHESTDASVIDTLSLWKVLTLLGYTAVGESDQPLIASPFLDATALLDQATKTRLIKQTNDVIKATQL